MYLVSKIIFHILKCRVGKQSDILCFLKCITLYKTFISQLTVNVPKEEECWQYIDKKTAAVGQHCEILIIL